MNELFTLFGFIYLKSGLVLLLGFILLRVFTQREATFRYMLWKCILFALILLPLVVIFVPSFSISLYPKPTEITQESIKEPTSMSGTQSSQTIQNEPISAQTQHTQNTSKVAVSPQKSSFNWQETLLVLWGIGVVFLLLRWAFQVQHLRKLHRKGIPLLMQPHKTIFQQLLVKEKINLNTHLLFHPKVLVPMTWGIWRPTVIFPNQCYDLASFEMLVQHELVHIKHRDFVYHLLWQAISILYWMNPLIWIATREIIHTREEACDEKVLERIPEKYDYATCLISVARSLKHPSIWQSSISMASTSEISRRIQAILNPKQRGTLMKIRWLILTATILSLLFVGMIHFDTQQRLSQNFSRIMFIHAMPEGDEVGIELLSGSIRILLYQDQAFNEHDVYTFVENDIESGERTFKLYSNDDKIHLEKTFEILPNKLYALILVGTPDAPDLLLVENELHYPEEGKRRITIINGDPTEPFFQSNLLAVNGNESKHIATTQQLQFGESETFDFESFNGFEMNSTNKNPQKNFNLKSYSSSQSIHFLVITPTYYEQHINQPTPMSLNVMSIAKQIH